MALLEEQSKPTLVSASELTAAYEIKERSRPMFDTTVASKTAGSCACLL
jgi:hypothetical protein